MKWILICAALAACGNSKKDDRAAAGKAAPRDVATARKVLAAIRVPTGWDEIPSDGASRTFSHEGAMIDLYLDAADDHVLPEEQPPTSAADLVERAKHDKYAGGWPWWTYRFASVAASGDRWLRGPLEENAACGDRDCDPAGWKATDEDGAVVYRDQGDLHVRCAVHGHHAFGGIDELVAWCRTGLAIP